MKPIWLSLAFLLGAGSAGAEVIRWSYFENPLTYDATASSLAPGTHPLQFPPSPGRCCFPLRSTRPISRILVWRRSCYRCL